MLGLGNSITSGSSLEGFVDLNSVSSLQLWLKNGTGVAVDQWDDSSGNARHATQATSGNQAAVSGGGLDFEEGESDHYDLASEIVVAKSQGFCVAWVQDAEGSNSNNTILSDTANEVIQIQNVNKIRITTNDDSNVESGLFTSGAYDSTKMLILVNRTGAGVWSVYKNGTELTIEPDSGSSTNSDDGENIMGFTVDTLGARRGTEHFFDGILFEVAFWDRALTDASPSSIY